MLHNARAEYADEERMQKFLAGLLPELTAGVAHAEIPISEMPTGAATGSART